MSTVSCRRMLSFGGVDRSGVVDVYNCYEKFLADFYRADYLGQTKY